LEIHSDEGEKRERRTAGICGLAGNVTTVSYCRTASAFIHELLRKSPVTFDMKPLVYPFFGRLRQKLVASTLMAVIVLAQFAVAAHACPRLPQAAATGEGHLAMASDPHAGCHDGAQATRERSALCKAHCVNDGQQAVKVWTPDTVHAGAVMTVPAVPMPTEAFVSASQRTTATPHASPDPPFLRSAVLRI
jgi:hypothetical protein